MLCFNHNFIFRNFWSSPSSFEIRHRHSYYCSILITMEAQLDNVVADTAVEEQAADIPEFEPIERLEELGVNKLDIKKAREAGFYTVDKLVMEPKKILCDIKGLSEAKVDKMLEAAKKLCNRGIFQTALELDAVFKREIVRLSTGSAALDDLLGGGVETKALTEIYGEFRCGKTQIALNLCVTSQINEKNPGKVVFIDTEGTFRPSRVAEIAARYELNPVDILQNIVFARAFTYEQQMEYLDAAAAMMVKEPFKLLIFDSLTSIFRTDFSGRGELSERQQKLNQLLSKLKKLANEFNIAVFYTNQVMSDPSGGAMFVSDPKKAIGGHVIAHASTFRISVRKGKGAQRLAKLVQSPNLPEAEASFSIVSGGIADSEE